MRNLIRGTVAILTLLSVVFCSGCLERQLDAGHYRDYFSGGLNSLKVGHFETSKKCFIRAYQYAEDGRLGPGTEAAALYNYSISVGQLGDFEEAEVTFKKTMELDEKADGPDGPYTTMRLFELARLYQAWKRYDLSVMEYERGISLLKQKHLELDDPIGYATLLEDYSNMLRHTGKVANADAVEAEAAKIRKANPGIKSKITFRYYPAKSN